MMTTALLVALLLGQTITPVKVTDPTQPSAAVTTTPVATKRGLDVNVIGGGAGGGAVTQATTPWVTQDNHTTAVAPLACRLTDGTSFYTAGGSTGLTDAQLRATPVPVSGTFWQATQPVSWTGQSVGVTALPGSPAQEHTAANSPNSCRLSDGAAFITTLPVSLASVPSHAVTGSGNFTVVQPTGTNLHVVVDSAPTTAVTGTFWQATQPTSSTQLPAALGPQTSATSLSVTPATGATFPVSGTFWQTTQPVSIASMPSTPVTGTFWQATQPVSSTQLPAALGPQASASSFSVTPATGATFPVSGTFWQTTQPVSGPLTDTQLRATPVPVSGTVTATVSSTTANQGTPAATANAWPTKIVDSAGVNVATVTAAGAQKVDGSAVTQPVSGTFWQATQPVSSTQLPAALGAQAVGASMSVVPATASSFTVAQPTGTNLHVVVDTAPTTAVTGPLTDTQLRATAVPVSGSVTATVTSTTVTNTVATKVSKVAAAPLSTAVSVSTSATALPASVLTNRVSLCVYNNGASTMYLGPAGVTTANGLPLPAGGSFCDDVGAQVYYAVVAAGSVEARVLEN